MVRVLEVLMGLCVQTLLFREWSLVGGVELLVHVIISWMIVWLHWVLLVSGSLLRVRRLGSWLESRDSRAWGSVSTSLLADLTKARSRL